MITHGTVQPRGSIFLFVCLAMCWLPIANVGLAQQLSCEFNQNSKQIKIVCSVCPKTEGANFAPPSTSDATVVSITRVVEGTVEKNGMVCAEQVVHLRTEKVGLADVTVGTASETQTFEFTPQPLMFAVAISRVLAKGALPDGDFIALTPGDTFDLAIDVIDLTDESLANVDGLITAELKCKEANPGFAFENGTQLAPLKVVNGQTSTRLSVAPEAVGQTCVLEVRDETIGGPQLLRTNQLFLGVARVEESTREIVQLNQPISFLTSAQDALAEMTFSRESLDSVTVAAFRGDGDADRPGLFIPPFPQNNSVRRYYQISAQPSEAAFEARLKLTYKQSEFDKGGLQDEADLLLYRFNGTNWEEVGGQVDPDNNSVTVENVQAFSFWAFAEPAAVPTTVAGEAIPEKFALEPNYPNPFNPETTIRYSLHTDMHVTLTIYNLLGQEIKTLVDAHHKAGVFRVVWQGRDEAGNKVTSGVYIYQLKSEGFVETRKMILLQ
ncbi:MAG: T9SS type A sorting domain-containing protein [bacterium]